MLSEASNAVKAAVDLSYLYSPLTPQELKKEVCVGTIGRDPINIAVKSLGMNIDTEALNVGVNSMCGLPPTTPSVPSKSSEVKQKER